MQGGRCVGVRVRLGAAVRGHYLEGNRPALLTNIFQILVAPIFLTAELSFGLGWRPGLQAQIERRPGQPAVNP